MFRKRVFYNILLVVIAFVNCSFKNVPERSDYLTLWYKFPAAQWKESLPIGNGHMGTMIAGNIESDTLVINEETIWSGGVHDYANPEAFEHLQEIRRLILQEKYDEALAVGDKYMIGLPRNQQRYQPLGNLIFKFDQKDEVANYKRSLNLNKAVVTISYVYKGYSYKREYFASYPDNVMVMHFTTNNPEGMHFSVKHNSQHESEGKFVNNRFVLSGKGDVGRGISGDIRFESNIEILTGKEFVKGERDGFTVNGGKNIVLVYTAATNYKKYNDVSGNPSKICSEVLDKLSHKDYSALLKNHVTDYSTLFSRVVVNFGTTKIHNRPTNELVELARKDSSIPYLDELFYQMGRYLIIAGSREGTQPLNLQGIWNDNMSAPWDCKWTLNINLPMNYWMVEAANLSECHEPLFSLLTDLRETGTKIAREHYGCRGFVAHHNTDLWRGAAPVDGANWGLWTFGGAWLTRHLWEHYQYSQDKAFLKKAYPYLKEASLFFFDYLSKGKDKYLVTSPSVSFEQSYVLPNGKFGRLCEGSTMDNQILRDLFSNCLKASQIIDDDKSFQDSLVLMSGKLRPATIDSISGQIMEWAWPAQPKNISGQLAPLWGVNPGCEINYMDSPELAAAAEKTIRARDPYVAAYEKTGSWVSGTRANFWARLSRGDEAYKMYKKTVKENLFPNLLVSFYPQKYFMIDGNLGLAASMNEMLMQSHRKNTKGQVIIDLLPALPSAWENGRIEGIRARGGVELSIEWKKGKLFSVKAYSETGTPCEFHYKNALLELKVNKGKVVTWVSK